MPTTTKPRPQPRRTDDQDPPGRRWPRSAIGHAGHRGPAPSTQLEPLLDAIRVPRPGSGRPRKRPAPDRRPGLQLFHLSAAAAPAADRPHHPRALRPAAGPSPTGRQGRPAALVDPVRYRQRNVVERAVARLKQHRAIATRYDKLAVSYHSWLVLAALLLWLPT